MRAVCSNSAEARGIGARNDEGKGNARSPGNDGNAHQMVTMERSRAPGGRG